MVRVKICGLTREQDVRFAVAAGADALGFVFAPGSKRRLTLHQAAELVQRVPPFVTRVGLFLDQEASAVRAILDRVPLNLLQFHGREDGAYCGQFGRPYIKAVSMESPGAVQQAGLDYADAAGLLLDSHAPGGLGGTGETFDWRRVEPGRLPLILAGGLTPDNVAEAIRRVRPWAVDVSSGVETAPGIKSDDAVRKFILEAKREY
jgi:phosphoribosylanthranilate isomerase